MSRFMAAVYDPFMRRTEAAGLSAWRAELLAGLSGRVLEVGAGTGANLPYYPDGLTRLVAAEPDPHMRAHLLANAEAGPLEVEVSDAGVAPLPFAAGSFDAVVCTLVLCSVPDPQQALAEVRRVLRPGGRFVFIEHVVDTRAGRRRLQHAVQPLWGVVADGCSVTRDTEAEIVAAGFDIETIVRASMRKALPWVRPSIRGSALAPLR